MDLKRMLNDHGLDVDEGVSETLERYLEFLRNSPMNLTSIDPEDMPYKVVLDTLYPLREFPIDDTFIDVGTGGGIPGVVISIVHGVEGVLLDSRSKKLNALRGFVERENLKLELVHGRAEDLGHDPRFRERFLYVLCRALAPMRTALELTAPFATLGGYILMYKGRSWREELEVSWKVMEMLGVDLGDVLEYELPSGEKRSLIILEKIERTPKRYPRKAGLPEKRPLG